MLDAPHLLPIQLPRPGGKTSVREHCLRFAEVPVHIGAQDGVALIDRLDVHGLARCERDEATHHDVNATGRGVAAGHGAVCLPVVEPISPLAERFGDVDGGQLLRFARP